MNEPDGVVHAYVRRMSERMDDRRNEVREVKSCLGIQD
jgi:hypothetical protein